MFFDIQYDDIRLCSIDIYFLVFYNGIAMVFVLLVRAKIRRKMSEYRWMSKPTRAYQCNQNYYSMKYKQTPKKVSDSKMKYKYRL